MADFGYLVYYKEHPSDRMAKTNKDAAVMDYSKLPKRQRGASVCVPSLAPVVENDQDQMPEEAQTKPKRRLSLDFLFSRKKKQFKVSESGKRGSISNMSESEESSAEEIRRASINSIKLSNAEITAWVYT